MTDAGAWDGYPQERERDGWHWLRTKRGWPGCAYWCACDGVWTTPVGDGALPPSVVADFAYLGPCALPGEDRAAWLKGWEAAREGAAKIADPHPVPEGTRLPMAVQDRRWVAGSIAAAIRAMEPPKETQG